MGLGVAGNATRGGERTERRRNSVASGWKERDETMSVLSEEYCQAGASMSPVEEAVTARAPAVSSIRSEYRTAMPRWKRIMDVMGALFAAILLTPLMVCVAALIKVVSPGPVLYRQTRIGFRGRPFTCWKFRSMHVDNDASEHAAYVKDLIQSSDAPMVKLDMGRDPRLIPLGGLFRATAIDELPQLLCVLRGDMSLIGPRPCIPYEYEAYSEHHRRRLDAIPGLTGLWQVSGKNHTTFEEMVELDIEYSERKTIWLDLVILMMTPKTIFIQLKDIITSR